MAKPLKLWAKSLEDISVMSSLCQDALVSVADISFSREQQSFVAVLNRFCWEEVSDEKELFHRSHAGLCFDHVTAVAYKGLSRQNTDQILSLLAIAFAADEENAMDGAGHIVLQFAEEKAIRLTVSNLNTGLEDLGEKWVTQWKPGHEPD